MIVNLNLKNLITTNWDNLFEKAIVNNEKNISSYDDISKSRWFSKLIKMYGSLNKKNIIFTKSDYLSS